MDIVPTPYKAVVFMKAAYLFANECSKDPSTKIGAVLVRGDTPISTGFNGFPRGVKDSKSRYEYRQLKYLYVAHAEANAIYSAARIGAATDGCVLYTPCRPCNECAKAIIQAGVKKVVLHKQFLDMSHSHWPTLISATSDMLDEAGVEVEILDKILGLKTTINYNKYDV